jgi:flagella basal body P-ring formation protein FlgA
MPAAPGRFRRPRLLPGILCLAAGLACAPLAAQGLVAPRGQAQVEGGVVTLGDLFDGLGPKAAVVLGPSPAPGRRFVIESPQLAIIARDNGLSWQPLAGDERVVVERPGRPLAREEVEAVLRAELTGLGADPALDIELTGFQAPMVPAGPDPRLTVEGTEYDAASRRFSATLVVLADGMATLRQRLAGRSLALREVVLANRPLRAGEVLSARDVRAERIAAERVRPGMAEKLERVLGQRVTRNLPAGQQIPLAELAAILAVPRDSAVELLHEVPGLTIGTRGKALDEGAVGAVIPVLNLANGVTLTGEVLGPGRVRALGPVPTPPPGSRPGAVAQR